MGKMHELLAVEGDLEAVANRTIQEAVNTFGKKPALFQGEAKTYRPIKDTEDQESIGVLSDTRMIETTVMDKLNFVAQEVERYYDAALQKEATNQVAKADLIVNGVTIASDIPATFLLGLEKRLVMLRGMYVVIPTLAPGIDWIKDDQAEGAAVYKTRTPVRKYRTSKTVQHKVLYEATNHHPAQIERWDENENIGVYETTLMSGMISSAMKATLLSRLDDLLRAVKQARQRANSVDAVEPTIGSVIFTYLHKDLLV